jgi:hypothetical protein
VRETTGSTEARRNAGDRTLRGALATAAAAVLLAPGAAGQAPDRKPPGAEFVFAGAHEPLPASLRSAVDGLSSGSLAAHVRFLASPALEGRGLGSRGLDAALEYVAAQLALAGVEPGGAGAGAGASWFQQVPMREIRQPGGGLDLERRSGEATLARTFVSGVDVVVSAQPARSVSAPVVFAGYGIRETSPSRDDWRGLDVQGKVVVLREGLPPGDAFSTKELRSKWAEGDAEERWAEKAKLAKELGAVGVLAIEGEEWAARRLEESAGAPVFRQVVEPGSSEPLLVRCAPAVLEALLGAVAMPEEAPRSLPGITATLRASGVESLALGRSVVGILRGSDPARRDEAVVLGAHVDHLGRVEGVVHPGADDNASGVAALIEIARAFAAAPVRPKRTLVFAAWTGEEEDKIGSGHWVRSPRWPLAKTVAYLNFDMIAHPWKPDEIRKLLVDAAVPELEKRLASFRTADFVEPGVASFAPFLEPVLARAGRATALALHLDRTEGVDGGSDYRDFARARVPFVRFFGSFHPDYHRPGDTPVSIDPDQIRRVTRLGLATAWLLADR